MKSRAPYFLVLEVNRSRDGRAVVGGRRIFQLVSGNVGADLVGQSPTSAVSIIFFALLALTLALFFQRLTLRPASRQCAPWRIPD